MKYQQSIIINKPVDEVSEKVDSFDNMKYWQDGFQGYTHLSGTAGEVGAETMLHYDFNGRPLDLKETIIESNLPTIFKAKYECDPMDNFMTVRLIPNGDGTTTYQCEVEYTRFKGIMMKLIAKLYPSMFKKQGQKWYRQLKAFIETGETFNDNN